MGPHLASLLSLVAPTYACPGQAGGPQAASSGQASEVCTDHRIGREMDASACARRVELVGSEACAWTTGAMAQRVLEEGTPWSFVGRLTASPNALPSKVAAPYTLGPDGEVFVVANVVLEKVQESGIVGSRLEFVGRLLEVDGTSYFVATEVSAKRS
jgi:hypothetical protein